MDDISAIGARLRQIRKERGYSQERLAERTREDGAGVSADHIKKIEAGDRQPGIAVLYALSRALSVPPSRLLDRRERLEREIRDHGLLSVRDALLGVSDLSTLGLDDPGAAAALPALERAVDDGWAAYWAGEFGTLTALLPPLVISARASRADLGAAAARPLAQAYQLAADLLVHMGDDNLAFAAALRALRAASDGDDELQHATLAGTASWILLHMGRLDDAEKTAAAGAALVSPGGGASLSHLNVYGALLLSAAAPCAARGDSAGAARYLEEARVIALRFTAGDRHDYMVSFGPTQVAMQQCHCASVLGEHGQAIRASRRVVRDDLLHISYGAHMLDVAQAHLAQGRRGLGSGIEALWAAYGVSAEWARHQGLFRTLVGSAQHQETRQSQRVRRMAATAGQLLTASIAVVSNRGASQ